MQWVLMEPGPRLRLEPWLGHWLELNYRAGKGGGWLMLIDGLEERVVIVATDYLGRGVLMMVRVVCHCVRMRVRRHCFVGIRRLVVKNVVGAVHLRIR